MSKFIKKFVELSIEEFLEGVKDDTMIGNVMISWHGEGGTLSEACVAVTPKGEDGRFSEKDGKFLNVHDYVNNVKFSVWFKNLVDDTYNLVNELLTPIPEDELRDLYINELRNSIYNTSRF